MITFHKCSNSYETRFFSTQLTGQYDLSLKGSPYWMAPEVCVTADVNFLNSMFSFNSLNSFQVMKAAMLKDANPNLALAVDIWSLGCTIIEMLDGKPPWSEFEGVSLLSRFRSF